MVTLSSSRRTEETSPFSVQEEEQERAVRVITGCLNCLGYIPKISTYIGEMRIGLGAVQTVSSLFLYSMLHRDVPLRQKRDIDLLIEGLSNIIRGYTEFYNPYYIGNAWLLVYDTVKYYPHTL